MKQVLSFFLMVIITIILQEGSSFIFASVNVDASSKIINTDAIYEITYNRTTTDTLGKPPYESTLIYPSDNVTCVFPPQFSLNAMTLNCSVAVDNDNFMQVPCQVQGNKVIATKFVNTSTIIGILKLSVGYIKNPSPAITTQYFTGTVGNDSSGNGNSPNPDFISSVSLQPGTFQNCFIQFSPNIVNSTADMIITLQPSNQIQSDGYINIIFSNIFWINDISYQTHYLPIGSQMACSNKSQNIQQNITCNGQLLARNVTVKNLFQSIQSSSFSFSINNFLSPPTNQPSDPIVITSYINGYALDSCTTYVSNLSPEPITDIKIINPISDFIIVNKPYTIQFSFNISDTITNVDTISITFPPQSFFLFDSSTMSSTFSIQPNICSYNSSTGVLNVFMQNTIRTFPKYTPMLLNVGNYTAPPSIQPTDQFTISIFRNGYIKMIGTTTLTASPSFVTGSVSMNSTSINSNTSYIFNITTLDTISASGMIKIVLPPTVQILTSSPSCANISVTNISKSPICLFNTTQNQNSIVLTNLNSSISSISPSNIIIIINGLKNPASTAPTSNFIISTYYTNNYSSLVAIGTLPGVAAMPAKIDPNNVTIVFDSYTVNAYNVTCNISVYIQNYIPQDGFILIYFPPDFQFLTIICNIKTGLDFIYSSCTRCQDFLNQTGTCINFTQPFNSPVEIGTYINISFPQIIINPSSTKPTQSLQLYTFDDTGYVIASLSNSMIVQMKIPDTFISIKIGRSSQKNNDIANYTFSIVQKSQMSPSSVVIIGFPNNVRPSLNSVCWLETMILLTCSYSQFNSMVINLPSNQIIPSNSKFTLTITDVINPPSFAPISVFNLATQLEGSIYTYSNDTYQSGLKNSISSNFQVLTYQFNPSIYNSQTNLSITFQPSNSGIIPSWILLIPADSFTISTLSCAPFVNFQVQCTPILGFNDTLNITGSFNSGNMTVNISGFKSPVNVPSDFSTLVSFDSEGYQLDFSADVLIFMPFCTMPCKNCQLSNRSACTDCYLDQQITKAINYDSSRKSCYQQCLSNTFLNSTSHSCQSCGISCLTCINSSYCQLCDADNPYLYTNSSAVTQSCVGQCPGAMFANNLICQNCAQQCKSCNSLTSCMSCTQGYFYFNNSCLENCPQDNTTIVNISNSSCDPCDISCKMCQNIASNCTKCKQGDVLYKQQCLNYTPERFVNISGVAQPCTGDCYNCSISQSNCTSCQTLYLYNNTCVSSCNPGYLQLNNECVPCQSPCFSCKTSVNICVSCINSTFLINDKCNYTCPLGTYPNSTDHTCSSCLSSCQQCISLTNCSSCVMGYNLLNNTCRNSCIEGYVAIQKICQPCTNNCKACTNYQTNCTKCINNTYLLAVTNSCVKSCDPGLFIDYASQSCVSCSSECKTCKTVPTECLSCFSGSNASLLLNGLCMEQCPSQYFPQVGQCILCPSSCTVCSSRTNCTECISTFALYNWSCLAICPPTDAIIINATCTKCSRENCQKCTPTNICYSCFSGYLVEDGRCVGQCSSGYESNRTHCISIVLTSMTSSSSFVVPFSIVSIVIIIACLMSKLQFYQTFTSGAIYAILGVVEWGVVVYFLFMYYGELFSTAPIPFLVVVGAMVYLYLLNFISFFGENIVFLNDKCFKVWLKDRSHKTVSIIVNIISLLINFKFRTILFSKLFTLKIFRGELQSIQKFKVPSIFSFLSLLWSTIVIFIVSSTIRKGSQYTQLNYGCIDVIVVLIINVVVGFFNIRKGDDFFYELTGEGFQLKKKIKVHDNFEISVIEPTGNQEGFISNMQKRKYVNTNESNILNDKDLSREQLAEKNMEEVYHFEKDDDIVSVKNQKKRKRQQLVQTKKQQGTLNEIENNQEQKIEGSIKNDSLVIQLKPLDAQSKGRNDKQTRISNRTARNEKQVRVSNKMVDNEKSARVSNRTVVNQKQVSVSNRPITNEKQIPQQQIADTQKQSGSIIQQLNTLQQIKQNKQIDYQQQKQHYASQQNKSEKLCQSKQSKSSRNNQNKSPSVGNIQQIDNQQLTIQESEHNISQLGVQGISVIVSDKKSIMLKPQKQQSYKQLSLDFQGYQSQFLEKSTKLQSELPINAKTRKQEKVMSILINESQMEKSEQQVNGNDEIHLKPIEVDGYNGKVNLSDGEYYHPSKFVGDDKPQFDHIRASTIYQKNSKYSSASITPISSANPKKVVNFRIATRNKFQNEQKPISQSGEDEQPVVNRNKFNLVVPFQTDKEETEFKVVKNQVKFGETTFVSKENQSVSMERQGSNDDNEILPRIFGSKLKMRTTTKISKHPNQFASNDQYQLSQYISKSKKVRKRKGDTRLQKDERVVADQLKKYYCGEYEDRTKEKKKKNIFNFKDIQKIYLHKMDQKKNRK